MASSEKFCLRWNDFEANISSAFRELRDDKDFFDVTLACDDEQISAHKVILSACSPFFRTILRRNRHDHPLLYLKGVKYVDLVAVLNFMYHGEVNVAQEELNSFLAVAEDLKVKGLTQNGSDKKGTNEPPPRIRDPQQHSNSPAPPLPKRPRPAPPQIQLAPKPTPLTYHEEDDDIQELVPVKSEPVSLGPADHVLSNSSSSVTQSESQVVTDDYGHESGQGDIVADPNIDTSGIYGGDDYADYGNYEEGGSSMLVGAATADGNKDPASYLMEGEGGNSWVCTLCGKVSGNLNNGKRHVKHVHMKLSEEVECPVCNKRFARKQLVDRHMKTKHQDYFMEQRY